MSPIIENIFKVIILGDPRVGKTTLRLRYIGEGFRKEYISTIGADFALATHGDYILQIWDLAGQETFQVLAKRFYRGAQGVIIVFDISSRESMTNIENWIDKFIENEGKLAPLVIFGNKIDLRDHHENPITMDEGTQFAKNLSLKYQIDIDYIETSALTGENINIAFEKIISSIVNQVD